MGTKREGKGKCFKTYLASNKLAVEGGFHQSGEQRLTQHLLSNLHQHLVVVDKNLDPAKLEDNQGSDDLPCCFGFKCSTMILKLSNTFKNLKVVYISRAD